MNLAQTPGRFLPYLRIEEAALRAMTILEKQRWELERAKGRDRYVLRHGLLRYGLAVGLIVVLVKIVVGIFTHHSVGSIWELLIYFGAFALGFGAFKGAMSWSENENDYNQPAEDKELSPPKK
jgi:hypothetical protein